MCELGGGGGKKLIFIILPAFICSPSSIVHVWGVGEDDDDDDEDEGEGRGFDVVSGLSLSSTYDSNNKPNRERKNTAIENLHNLLLCL